MPNDGHDDGAAPPPPRDELDAMLREWHAVHAESARAGRDRLLSALAAEPPRQSNPPAARDAGPSPVVHVLRRMLMNRYSPVAAAAMIALALLVSMLIPATTPPTFARDIVLAPEGGRLDAVAPDGNILGPCELTRTDVDVQISGFLTRVTLKQRYRNPHADKIEAVYTFPMSHRAAVDRMTMTIGDRVVVGEVKERDAARRIYEAARAQGRIASLLEQERPNIFTQSVANIEPGAAIDIEISYVELLEQSEGKYTFSFPTVVGPRYIPGTPSGSEAAPLPPELTPRRGLVLLAPATATITHTPDDTGRPALSPARLAAALSAARPCEPPSDEHAREIVRPWHTFTVAYPDGASETGLIDVSGVGHINGRWFWIDAEAAAARDATSGEGFSPNTNRVPDASRITPMPVRPPTRAGHDLGITVTIDTGGPGIADLAAPLHEIVRADDRRGADGAPSKVRIALKDQDEIPNRDFVLSWSLAGDAVHESVFTHNGEHGGFFSLILQPPARVAPEMAVPRELIFVLDTSGSMQGEPIERAKAVMARSIESMRERDTFNLITFSGDTHILWDTPRPNTPENRAEAQRFLASRRGGGGTEMMQAIEAALRQTPAEAQLQPEGITLEQLVNLPADGREVTVELPWDLKLGEPNAAGLYTVAVRDGLTVLLGPVPPTHRWNRCPVGMPQFATGAWVTENGERVLRTTPSPWDDDADPRVQPLRLVTFFTDGYVGNDMAIIDAIRRNRATTRVFSFGVGNSVNRYLLDNMAKAGGGEAEYVLLASDADEAVERFTRRISTPVLANINVAFSDGLKVVDVLPDPAGGLPDLFDLKPLVIHGRYTAPGAGTVTITGTTGAGPYTRTITLDLPESNPAHDTIATLWAREKVETVMNRDLAAAQRGTFPADLQREVVTLGETFGIMTQYTSFVAVDRLRVTIGGEPRLVTIPIEMPQGVSWEGVFGEGVFGEEGELDDDLLIEGRPVQLGIVDDESRVDFRNLARIEVPEQRGQAPLTLHARELEASETEESTGRALTRNRGRDADSGGVAPQRRAAASRHPRPAPAAAPPPPATSLPSPPEPGPSAQPEGMTRDQFAPLEKAAAPATAGQPARRRDAGKQSSEGAELAQRLEEVEAAREQSESEEPLLASAKDGPDRPHLITGATSAPNARFGATLLDEPGAAQRTIIVPPEFVAVRIAALVAADKPGDATTLAATLATGAPDYATGLSMHQALTDPALDAAARKEIIAQLGKAARAELDALARAATLRRRLDPALLAFTERSNTEGSLLPTTLVAAYTGDKPEGSLWQDGGVLVTILVKSADDAAAKAVRALGAKVQHTSPSTNVIVAAVPLGKLADLALLDGVQRVEPTRFSGR